MASLPEGPPAYAELAAISNFSFLRGASHPHELVERAHALGYRALALADECSLAGVVRAHVRARELGLQLIVGSLLRVGEDCRLLALVTDRQAYAELSGLITLARRRCPKGRYQLRMQDLRFRLKRCLIIWLPDKQGAGDTLGAELRRSFEGRLWIGVSRRFADGEAEHWRRLQRLARDHRLPLVACGEVEMHCRRRKPLHDVLAAIRLGRPVQALGTALGGNAEACLRSRVELARLYPPALLAQTLAIAGRCDFSLDELKYQYPAELVPAGLEAIGYLRQLAQEGARRRWPRGVPGAVHRSLERELALIEELGYEYFFLTVHDVVRFAREQGILCQGRGSAANSVVCYCLHITEVSPEQIDVLFERFISKERNEPPDIDVDFESQRREEVIQYIYGKYSRKRAALAATVITYRTRSAVRDVGKALGFSLEQVDRLAKSLAWWDRGRDLARQVADMAADGDGHRAQLLVDLVQEIQGFPRHLSQHVGGFVIAQDQVSDLVPLENAAMPERTIIQWDKDDLESLGLLKVDVLSLGMLSALRRALELVSRYEPRIRSLGDIPREDPATYAMLCRADAIGVFQVESRAQMSMLPRLKPRCFYDLVIEIAIVRPGPIQGDMVQPYLKRRNGLETEEPASEALHAVLRKTLGVPIFQEQAIRIAMVAAGFSGGEADRLRRAMASWGKNGNLLQFEDKFIQGMLDNGYSRDYANRLFEQIKGFGGYGFPESHSASFALLCYFSSWLKCHHPAAFYCALLNSQPMGFYSPSQLIQDARRHDIAVLPVDVQHSQWENSLEGAAPPALRLGLNRVSGLGEAVGQRIVAARGEEGFRDPRDLARRARVPGPQLQLLAAADALRSISGHRHQSHWDVAGIEDSRPLLYQEGGQEGGEEGGPGTQAVRLAAPSLAQNIAADYRTTGLSLRPHPMALLRAQPPFNRCTPQAGLAGLGNGRFVRVAGIVTGRQRPGTARGTLFLTLEDETGNINVIVWKRSQEHFREALLGAQLLLVKGVVETDGEVVHVIAGSLHDYSHSMRGFQVRSRDFH
ncbi:error-prone DNA polymerase [Parahaliea mediterranea]|uniref:Error-prone DNA polymerase n=1 Tax=Parahaliea mediterranea TaxID=651086 RepID=A0A939IP25_9GAMM|nr:error-prone DNA polymerase [Parahaliea mediterranea]MBN7799155.1 error-prone DNA polymerase [Parahaliea mediterranea]